MPWALGAYLIFTLIRLYGSWRGRLPGWFPTLSVLIDMSLPMLVIWSFHLQYEQPPSFYLKAPTLLYVFIFIAAALRFEARYVAIAGAAAIVGWAVLVVYAVDHQPLAMSATTSAFPTAIPLGPSSTRSSRPPRYHPDPRHRARPGAVDPPSGGHGGARSARFFDKSVAEQIRGRARGGGRPGPGARGGGVRRHPRLHVLGNQLAGRADGVLAVPAAHGAADPAPRHHDKFWATASWQRSARRCRPRPMPPTSCAPSTRSRRCRRLVDRALGRQLAADPRRYGGGGGAPVFGAVGEFERLEYTASASR